MMRCVLWLARSDAHHTSYESCRAGADTESHSLIRRCSGSPQMRCKRAGALPLGRTDLGEWGRTHVNDDRSTHCRPRKQRPVSIRSQSLFYAPLRCRRVKVDVRSVISSACLVTMLAPTLLARRHMRRAISRRSHIVKLQTVSMTAYTSEYKLLFLTSFSTAARRERISETSSISSKPISSATSVDTASFGLLDARIERRFGRTVSV